MFGARDRSTNRAAVDDDADNNNTSSFAARRAAARQATPKYEPIETKKIECPECGQKFVSERAMNIHLSTMYEKTTKVLPRFYIGDIDVGDVCWRRNVW